jgi:pimeloyl-ACP methyl ester carboxylesterase
VTSTERATTTRHVTSTDGVALAVHETGDPASPTVVAVHGYPDDHAVWDGVVGLLADDFHVVAYDVRGAGGSQAAHGRAGYRIPQLVEDLGAVLDAVAPGEPVHLLAHDWGSIQSWSAVTDPRFADRLASFTSISGPSLDMASVWMRGLRGPDRRAALRQLADSWYIGVFRMPLLPEMLIRAGLLDRAVAGTLRTPTQRRAQRDQVNGLELYRANFLAPGARSAPVRTSVPVMVLAPRHDPHVTVRLQLEAPVPYAESLLTRVVEGGHWVVSRHPERIVDPFRDFVASLT